MQKTWLNLDFLHKSFQEFFAVFFICAQIQSKEIRPDELVSDPRYFVNLEEVLLFSRGILAMKCDEQVVALVKSLSACPREHQAVVLHTISPISVKFCQSKGSTPKLKVAKWFLFSLFPGGDRPPPGFIGFSPRNRLKICKMYEALTATISNILLWQFADMLLYP